MESKQRYTLKKNEKLKSRKAIEQLFEQGRSFSVFPFRVIYLEARDLTLLPSVLKANVQAGFSVSKKHFKKAVDRNRVKRLMREAYRLQKNELLRELMKDANYLTVFFIYVGNELPDYELIFTKMGSALNRLLKIAHENNLADT